MAMTKRHYRWHDLERLRGPDIRGAGTTMDHVRRDGVCYQDVVAYDRATLFLAEAEELRAPARLSTDDLERELGLRA